MCTFWTAWGDAFVKFLGGSRGLLPVLYSLAHFLEIYLVLACRPADIVLPNAGCLFFEGLQSWLGGLASLAFCGVGLLFVVLLFYGQYSIFMSVLLLVTRLGSMPCSAWSKKKGFESRASLCHCVNTLCIQDANPPRGRGPARAASVS